MGMRSGKALQVQRTAKRTAAKRAKNPVAKSPARRAVTTRAVAVDANAELRKLARHIVDVTLSNDQGAMLALYDDAVESTEASSPPTVGIQALRDKFDMFRRMVSSALLIPRAVLADGSTIVIEWDGRMTLAESGQTVELHEVAVHEIENGKIVRERYWYDPSVLQP
ncbi:MAG: nuclear transport factor 2 family protein [Candidatus Binatia bacterium]